MSAPSGQQRRGNDAKVRAHWNETVHPVELTFYGFPPLREYFYRCITGSEPRAPLGRDWFERWAVENVLGGRAPMGECLSLCCGFGEIERILAGLGAFRSCVALDIAPEAIAAANAAAADAGLPGLEYRTADIQTTALEPQSVDLVWANGALHHISDLEWVVGQACGALRPGGLLVANEYVGPNHHQLDARAVELVNAFAYLIPDRLRGARASRFVPERYRHSRLTENVYRLAFGRLPPADRASGWRRRALSTRNALRILPGRSFGPVFSNNPWYYRAVDPSEGVRASEIVPILEATFDEVDVLPYNGSILPHVFDQHFYRSFDPASDADRRLLTALTQLEADLIAAGEVAPHHAAIVCRKRT